MPQQAAPAGASSEGTKQSLARLLAGTAHALESDKGASERIRHVLAQLRDLVPYDRCAFLALSPDGEKTLTTLPAADGPELGRVRAALERVWALLAEDESPPREINWGQLEHWRSCLAVPLVGFDETVGVLALGRDAPDAYNELDLQLLAIVGAQLASYLTALRARAEEREQQRRAQRHSEERKRRLEVFLAMLSHELRNPLAPIRTSIELLHLKQGDARIRQQALATLDRQVHNLTRLVDDLLDVSRVTTGRIQLQRVDAELNDLVKGVADSFRPQMQERRHQFSFQAADGAVWVRVDPARLEQVVGNLLSNAAKYTPPGGWVRLTVAQERDAGQAVIRVRDSGEGIPPGLRPRVFELFSQGERPLGHHESGLGLGLALVKSLVELHEGTVAVESDGPGKGSEFVVRLPVVPSPVSSAEPSHSAAGNLPAASSLRVLLVDDVADTRTTGRLLLEDYGYQVRTAHDGPSAVQAAQEFEPHVVLLDIGLPGMDGYEVAQRIRRDAAGRDVVLIAATGYAQTSDQRRSKDAGFDHHLIKPLDFATTLHRLLESIAQARGL